MRLTSIAMHNLQRRKGRAIFLVVGLLIGVATVVTLMSISRSMTIHAQDKMEHFGANILITPQTEHLSLSYGGITLGDVTVDPVEIEQDRLSLIGTIPNRRNIAAVAPKVLGAVSIQGQHLMLMGVDPKIEFGLKKWWSIDGMPIQSSQDLILGANVAKRLNLKPGDPVQLSGRPFVVSGVLKKTASQDDHLVIADLATSQELLAKTGQVSLVEVAALCKDCPVHEIVAEIQTVLPEVDVNAIQQVVKSRMQALDQFRVFSYGVAAVVTFIGALVVFVTMMGSVNERTREIGIFRALGFRRGHVMRLILTESVTVRLIAGIIGFLSGMGATDLILPFMGDGKAPLVWDPVLGGASITLAVVVGLIASIYPALHASRMDPTEALRTL